MGNQPIGHKRKRQNDTLRKSYSSFSKTSILFLLFVSSSNTSLLFANALGSAFSCGSSLQEARSCTTLCSTNHDHNNDDSSSWGGRGGGCPPRQMCYAGITCDPSKSMDWILNWQERLEERMMKKGGVGKDGSSSMTLTPSSFSSSSREARTMTSTTRIELRKVHSFVCGRNYMDAETRCTNALKNAAETTSTSGGSNNVNTGVHYCPTGTASECPGQLQCYAAVPCIMAAQSQSPTLVDHRLPLDDSHHGSDDNVVRVVSTSPPATSDMIDNILSRLDVDSLEMALSSRRKNETSATILVLASSNNVNMTTEYDDAQEPHPSVDDDARSTTTPIPQHYLESLSFSWRTFFHESLSSMMRIPFAMSSSSSPSSHPSLRHSFSS